MPPRPGISGGMTLGSEGEGKIQVRGYLVNENMTCLKNMSITLHVNRIDRGSPMPFGKKFPASNDHPLRTNGQTHDKVPQLPNSDRLQITTSKVAGQSGRRVDIPIRAVVSAKIMCETLLYLAIEMMTG
jgi:hypothetical protein